MKNSVLAFALLASACTPIVDQRGNLPHADVLAQVTVGKTDRDQVLDLLGSPSSAITYGDETWHYISSRTETVAFFEPKVMERRVITIVFDQKGLVKSIDAKGLEDGKTFQTVERMTPTAGKEMSILEQLLGNIGRFSKDAATK